MALHVEVVPTARPFPGDRQAGDRSIPAGRACAANATVIADEAAAGVGA